MVVNKLPRPLNKSGSTGFSKFGGGVSSIRSFVGKYVGAFLISKLLGLRYLISSAEILVGSLYCSFIIFLAATTSDGAVPGSGKAACSIL